MFIFTSIEEGILSRYPLTSSYFADAIKVLSLVKIPETVLLPADKFSLFIAVSALLSTKILSFSIFLGDGYLLLYIPPPIWIHQKPLHSVSLQRL